MTVTAASTLPIERAVHRHRPSDYGEWNTIELISKHGLIAAARRDPVHILCRP